MITEPMSLVFLVAVFGLFWYIFRGLRGEEENPIWGTILASGINFIICALLAIWFIQGNIVQIYMVSNDTHTFDFLNMTQADVLNITQNSTTYINQLGAGGSGMYLASAVEQDNLGQFMNQSITHFYHHNLVYAQIQDMIVGLFFAGLAIVSFGLFGWFCIGGWDAWQEQREEKKSNQQNPEEFLS